MLSIVNEHSFGFKYASVTMLEAREKTQHFRWVPRLIVTSARSSLSARHRPKHDYEVNLPLLRRYNQGSGKGINAEFDPHCGSCRHREQHPSVFGKLIGSWICRRVKHCVSSGSARWIWIARWWVIARIHRLTVRSIVHWRMSYHPRIILPTAHDINTDNNTHDGR